MTDPFGEEWFSETSQTALRFLFDKVRHLEGDVVEIGSWTGRSTCSLANDIHPAVLHAVDTWQGSPGEISAELAQERDVFAQFQRNVAAFTKGNVEVHRMGWRDYFAANQQPVRFCFIDAEHSYREVFDNIAAVRPLMVTGGIVCGDDNHHPPVQHAVVDQFGNAFLTASLWWVQI